MSLAFNFSKQSDPTILCLGAHSDDLEIGACATLLGLAVSNPNVRIVWVVFSGGGGRGAEARRSADYVTNGFQSAHIEIFEHRDGYFPYEAAQIKDEFERIKQQCEPDLVLTHNQKDLHQDHCLISNLTRQTFRDHTILEYEIPKYDGDLGAPNVFFPTSEELVEEKLSILTRFFESQKNRSWFSRDTFTSLMRLRGIECNSSSGYAEAFYCRKVLIQ